MENLFKSKKALRRHIQEERNKMSFEQRADLSFEIMNNLWSLSDYENAKHVFFFISFRSEVLTEPMIKRSLSESKTVMLPCTFPEKRIMIASEVRDLEKELFIGNYDIPEPREEFIRPVDPLQIDAVILPGVAFDEIGRRLGYGGGYYDRFLESCRDDCLKIALAFELQIVKEVPAQFHDQTVDYVITEKRIIKAKGRRE